MNKARLKQLEEFERIIDVKFHDKKLLNQSLTHSSYAYESDKASIQNERLEFLGDVVLSLAVSEYIYHKYPDYPEGELAKTRAMVVSRSMLAQRAKLLSLGDYLLLGKGEEQTGGRERNSILADTFEALVGAMYLDRGFEVSREFILKQLAGEIEMISKHDYIQDYKTQLQEYTQRRFKCLPVYKLVRVRGPDHQQYFEVTVSVKGNILAAGEGTNKKEAEQNAAYHALQIIRKEQKKEG
jgi:ribonuclease-3